MKNYNWKLPFRFIANLKIVQKLLLSYLLLILIPLLLISWVFYRNFSSFATEYVTHSTKQSFEQSYSFLSYKLNNVKEASNILLKNDSIVNTIKSDMIAKDDSHQMESMNTLLAFITSLQNQTDIQRIRLYVPDELIYSKDNFNIFNMSSAITSRWYKKLIESNKSYFWASSLYLGPDEPDSGIWENSKILNKDTLSLTKLLLNPENYSNSIAAVRLDFSKKDVVAILNKANTFSNSLTYIQDSEGEIVATSSNELLKKYSVKNLSFNNSTNNLSTWVNHHFINEKALIGYHLLENTDWSMVTITPLGNLGIESNRMKNIIFIFVLVISACAYIIAYIISRSITKGISELSNKMHNLHNRRLEPITIAHRKDEIGLLIDDYNYMAERMGELIKEQYKSGQMLKASELKALQSQINPHFLYNTLDMINWFARSQKGEEITDVVDALSQFYRISLSSGKSIISIRDELAHVSSYFHIQNMRFNNNLKLNINISEEILDYGILKITLQPIVENSILHGILCKESKVGTIEILGYQIDNDIIIVVKDDGIGMSEDSLSKIISGEILSQKRNSFGLKNIHERIELHFGIGYGLAFKSNLGIGTTVEIRIAREKP